MRSRLKRGLRIAALITGGLLIAAGLYVHTPAFRRVVEQRLETALGERIGRDVQVRLVSLRPLTLRARIATIRIAGRNEDTEPFVEAGELLVDARWAPLIAGRIHLSDLAIDGLRVDLDQVPSAPRTSAQATGTRPPSIAQLMRFAAIDRGIVTRGRLEMGQLGACSGVILDGIGIVVDGDPSTASYRAHLDLAHGTARTPDGEALSFAVEAEMRVAGDGVSIEDLALRANGIELRASAEVEDLFPLTGNATVDLELRSEEIPPTILGKIHAQGMVIAKGNVHFAGDDYDLDLDLSSEAITTENWTADDVAIQVTGSERTWDASFLLTLTGIALEGEIHSAPPPALAPFELHADLETTDVGPFLVAMSDAAAPPLGGSVRGSIDAGADSLDPAAIRGSFELALDELGPRTIPEVNVSSRIAGSWRDGALTLERLESTGPGIEIDASGRVGLDDRTELRLDLDIDDVGSAFRITRQFLQAFGVTDAIPPAADATRGRVELVAELRGPGLRELTVDALRGDVALDAEGVAASAGNDGLVSAEVTAAVEGHRLTVREAVVRGPGLRIQAEGGLGTEGAQAFSFVADVDDLGRATSAVLDELRALDVSALDWPDERIRSMTGALHADGTFDGGWHDMSGHFVVRGEGIAVPQGPARSLRAEASIERGRVDARARLEGDGADLSLGLRTGPYAKRPIQGTLDIVISEPSPTWWLDCVGLSVPADGHIEGRASVDLESRTARARLDVTQASWNGLPFELRDADVSVSPQHWTVDGAELLALGGRASVDGRLNADASTETPVDAPAPSDGTGRETGLRFRGEGFDIAAALRLADAPVDATGRVGFEGRLTGSPSAPLVDARLTLEGLALEGRDVPDLEGPVSLASGRWAIDLVEPGGTARVRSNGQLTPAAPWTVDVHYPLRLDVGNLAALGDEFPEIQADGDLHLQLEGEGGDPEKVRGSFEIRDLSVGFGETHLVARNGSMIRFANGKASLARFDLVGPGLRLRIDGEIDLAEPRTLSASAVGNFDLAPFGKLAAPARIGGNASLDLHVTGPLDGPRWAGQLRLRDGRLAHPEVQAPMEQIEAVLKFDPEHWRLEELAMRLGGGPVRGAGEYVASGAEAGAVRLELDGDDLRIRLFEGLRVETDARLRLDGSIEDVLTLSGRFDVARAAYEQDFTVGPQLLAKSRSSEPPSGVGGILDRTRLDIALEADGSVFLRNNVLAAETALSLRIGGNADEPRLTGRGQFVEGGRVFFRGVTYNITRGSVSYVDASPDNPTIDIEAETSVSSYDITLRATGRLQDPVVELSSSPSLPEVDIVSLLLTGKTRDSLTSGGGLSTTQAAIYLTRSWTKEMETTLQRTLGVDRIRIDPVLVEGDTEPTARVTVGKSLTGRTSATYSRALSGNQDDIYELRYEPRDRVSLVGRRDEDSELLGEVLYTRKFYVGPTRPPSPMAGGVGGQRIARVNIEGNRSIGTRRLRRDLELGKGDRFRRAVLLGGLDAIRDRYLQHGFAEALVDARVSEEHDGVRVDVTIDEGRRIAVRLEGLDRRRRGLKRELLTIWQRSVFPDTIGDESAERVRRHLRSEGFFGAEADAEVVPIDDGRADLRVRVDRGPRVRVERIVVAGNRLVNEERIREQILTGEAGWLTRGRLAPDVLDRDREAIQGLYVGLGYLDAVVREPEVRFSVSGKRAAVRIEIEEGRRYRLRRIDFSGNEAFDRKTLEELVTLHPGEPFVDQEVRQARSSLRRAYDRAGHSAVRVEVRPTADRADAAVDLELVIDEGPRKTVEAVQVTGTALTKPRAVQRELEIAPGDPLSADAVATTRQNLYRTGLFRSVTYTEGPGDTDETRELNFTVEEAPNLRTDYGLGYSTDEDVRASVAVSHSNLFGQRLYGSTGGRVSSTDWRAFALARQPNLFQTRLNGMVSTFVEQEEEDAFEVHRVGFTLQVDRTVSQNRKGWFAGYGLEEADVFQEGVQIDPSAGIPPDLSDLIDLREDSIFRLGNVYAGVLLGNRDDFAWPTRGSMFQAELSVYDQGLLSEAEFVRGFTQWTFHRRLGTRLIWNGGARLGLAEPYGGTPFIPISERFFAGGDNSIRGFDTDEIFAVGFPFGELSAAGITVDESPGGNALFVINQELVRPLIDPVSIAIFYDAGNLYWLIDDFDPTDLRHSAGLGLRLRTPIGPLRLEHGWKLDRRREESRGRVHFSIGLAF